MPAPLDYPRIIAEADTHAPTDPDTRELRARGTGRHRWFRLPGWLTGSRRAPTDGMSLPVLRDYPWRSSDGA